MNSLRQLWQALAAMLVAVLVTAPHAANAQILGGISGTVVDESGAAVAGATVTIVDSQGKTRPAASTDAIGIFSVAGVPLGRYKIQVVKTQFQVSRVDFDLTDNVPAEPLRITMRVAGVSQTVTEIGRAHV